MIKQKLFNHWVGKKLHRLVFGDHREAFNILSLHTCFNLMKVMWGFFGWLLYFSTILNLMSYGKVWRAKSCPITSCCKTKLLTKLLTSLVGTLSRVSWVSVKNKYIIRKELENWGLKLFGCRFTPFCHEFNLAAE